jgi:hypothetical protein
MSCFGNEATSNIASFVEKSASLKMDTISAKILVSCTVVLRNDASREWRHCFMKKYV